MWCETQARRPRARQNVLLSSAPHASTWRRGRHRQREHARDRAARAPQRQRPPARDAQHRVVGARLDRPVVRAGRSAIGAEPLERVVVLVGDRLVGHVAAGHHQRLADVGQQQVVERAVREHHARARPTRGATAAATRAPRPARREHDRPVAPVQQRRLDRPELDQLARRLEVARHQRERLLLAVLARPQPRDRLARRPPGTRDGTRRCPSPRRSAARIAQPRKGATHSSPRSGRPREGQTRSRARSPGRRSAGRGSGGRRGRAYSAAQASHIVKPAIVVSGRSYGTPRTIVKRGPQFGAVDERVAVAAVGGVEQLAQARRAGRGVGRDLARRARPAARCCRRSRSPARRAAARPRCSTPSITAASGGASAGSRASSASIAAGVALDLDHRAALVVAHEPVEPQLARQPVHVRPEADALDDALDPDPHALDRRPSFPWSLPHLVEHEAEQHVVGDEHGALAALRPVALGRARAPGATTASKPSHTSTPYTGPDHARRRIALGQQPEDDARRRRPSPSARARRPPAAACAARLQQPLRLLARQPRRRVLADQAGVDARTRARRSSPSRRRCRGTSRG